MIMKKYIFKFILLLFTATLYSQNFLEVGENCFNRGEYDCAITNYNETIKNTTGRDKQIAEIKLGIAKSCKEWLSKADNAFYNSNYHLAIENYQFVIDENPNDTYAKEQIEKCEEVLKKVITLSVSNENITFESSGNTETITVNTNAEDYTVSMLPPWCSVEKYNGYFRVSATANTSDNLRKGWFKVIAEDKEVTINVSQNPVYQNIEAALIVSSTNLTFSGNSGVSSIIYINTNKTDYTITQLPSWCKVRNKYSTWFNLEFETNPHSYTRNDWFVVRSGGKEIKIFIEQLGNANTTYNNTSKPSTSNKIKKKSNNCFNCPKTKNTWGLTIGYIQMKFESNYQIEGVQVGLRVEPLFKYGFGLNTGILLEAYSNDLKTIFKSYSETNLKYYNINIPLHLEYRLNISKWFNFFAYGGIGFNVFSDQLFENITLPATFEYGGGIRINHFQFNVGKSSYIGDFEDISNIGKNKRTYQNLAISMSYMF